MMEDHISGYGISCETGQLTLSVQKALVPKELVSNAELEENDPAVTVLDPSESPDGFYVDYDNTLPLIPPLHSSARLLMVDSPDLVMLELVDSPPTQATVFPNKVPILGDPRRNPSRVPITDHRLYAALRKGHLNRGRFSTRTLVMIPYLHFRPKPMQPEQLASCAMRQIRRSPSDLKIPSTLTLTEKDTRIAQLEHHISC
ncbi:hypothetical protein CVT26_011805 [Gymnopilus dilepis]|uniref:Uncharacterized protein n=1 Tax=Gymnopilus dilepis TaxID=231916 RepID=A0A409WCC6_9AGAR|nr:hypothetical protein CVT26_011805 [Gymnopilus dilepis]